MSDKMSFDEMVLKFFEPLPDGTWRDRETLEIIRPKKKQEVEKRKDANLKELFNRLG